MFTNSKKVIKSRYLPERSYLYYKYPQRETQTSLEFYFPLFENVDISESQKPLLGSYDLIGRAGTLYSYHGAKSREFSLKFYITLPNILDYVNNVGINSQFANSFRYFKYRENAMEIERFTLEELGVPVTNEQSKLAEDKYENFKNEDLPELGRFEKGAAEFVNDITSLASKIGNSSIVQLFGSSKTTQPTQQRNYIEYALLMINVIRTSTLNNSKNTNLGPPMIYINHGTLYNNIPCVCTNYSIRLLPDAGYHLKTMTPHRIEVSLSLSETRVGDFGEFVPFNYIKGENLAGWEAIIHKKTLDPYNDTFGNYDADVAMSLQCLYRAGHILPPDPP